MTNQALGGGAAMLNAAMGISSAAGTLVVGSRLDTAWAALPATAGILGTGAGSVAVANRMRRVGHRRGLAEGYAVAVVGSAGCVAATYRQSAVAAVLALVAGLFLLGVGNASALLSRYVAAERAVPARRAAAISLVVWLATIGAVGGPLLLGSSASVAGAHGLPTDTGPFVVAGCCAALAVLLMGRVRAGGARPPGRGTPPRVFEQPSARQALLALAGAQVIMVAVMTAAPMNMHMHGSDMSSIGMVLSAHTFGMFAFSPLTGVAVEWLGARAVIRTGLCLMVATSAATTAPSGVGQAIALLLLGYGWNLCFIAGSSLLAGDLEIADRLAVEGRVDATVWAFAAGAGLLSTIMLSAGGTALIAAFAAAVALAPYVAQRRSLESAGCPSPSVPLSGSGRRRR